ncbi:MAG: hypothetical protein D6721_01890 [Gammaproteobacteria bacterium]|nr:MAG: hypothetical protein D6721_01890 [Gammaproteobacteria bacterium]
MRDAARILLLCGCAALGGRVAAAGTVDVTRIEYRETEPGLDPYRVRMLVHGDRLRIDDGYAASDYVLYDAARGRVYSVTHEERRILVIPDGEVPKPPAALRLEVRHREDPEAPRVAGKAPILVQVRAGGKLCSESMVVAGLLPDAARLLRGYYHVLAARQARDLALTPKEFRTPCFLANYLHETWKPLEFGFPLSEHIVGGRLRLMLDYRHDELPDSLFRLPEGYERVVLGDAAAARGAAGRGR